MNACFDTLPELTPAHRDLLRVLRAAIAGQAPEGAPAVWEPVIELASLHQVSGFLYLAVRTWPPASQPAAALMARWRLAFLGAAAAYTRSALQARELLAALHAAGVRVIPLKGVWLAERIYEDGACRPVSDIDLLVPAEELACARAAVESIGYTTDELYLAEGNNKHVCYHKLGMPLRLELHWHLWHAGTEALAEPDLAQVWTGLHEELLHGIPVLAFPPERQLIHTAQHILQHVLAASLKPYLDLILLCRHYAPQYDLTRLEAEARVWQVSFGARFVLQVAGDIWDVRPPAALAPFLPPDSENGAARQAAMRAALQLTSESRQVTPSLAVFCHAPWFSRLKIGLARLFYPPGELRQSCPQVVRRYGLAGGYLWRCADLLRRHSRTLRKVSADSRAVDPALANFAARQTLGAWIREREARTP